MSVWGPGEEEEKEEKSARLLHVRKKHNKKRNQANLQTQQQLTMTSNFDLFAPRSFKLIARNKLHRDPAWKHVSLAKVLARFFAVLAAPKQERKHPLFKEKQWLRLIYRNPEHHLFVKSISRWSTEGSSSFLPFFTITLSQHHQKAGQIFVSVWHRPPPLKDSQCRLLKRSREEPQILLWTLEFSTFLLMQHTVNRQGPPSFKTRVRVQLIL